MQPGGIRPQPVLTRETAPVAFALRNIVDRKARGRLRAAATAEAIGRELAWTDAEGWRYQLEAPPRVTISPKDTERAAATIDLKVWDATGTLIFRDRIHAWDGFPVLVPDGTEHKEDTPTGKVKVSNFRESPLEAARADLAHTVRVVTKNGPWVKDKPGTVSTFYAGTGDGYIASGWDLSYSNAREGSSATSGVYTAAPNVAIGQRYESSTTSYICYQAFFPFDTSALSSEEVSEALFSGWLSIDQSTTDFTVELHSTVDWGTLAYADFVPGSSLGTAAATWATSEGGTGSYKQFTGDIKALLNQSGTTYLLLASGRQRVGNTPTGNEYIVISSADAWDTTQHPKLVVTHAPAAIVVTPGTASLTTAPFAPTTRLDKIVAPGVASLTAAVFAPTVLTPLIVTPGSLALTTDTFAPDLTSDITAIPGTLAAALTTFAPTVFTPRSVTPDTLSAVLAAFAPTAVVGEIARPDAASLALVAFAATALTPRLVTPDTLAAALTGFAPIASTSRILTPDQASLLLTAFAPLILTPVVVEPGIGELVTARFAPTTRLDKYAIPGTASLSLSAFAPDAAYTADVYLTPGPASLVIATYAPDVLVPVFWPFFRRSGSARFVTRNPGSSRMTPGKPGGTARFHRPGR